MSSVVAPAGWMPGAAYVVQQFEPWIALVGGFFLVLALISIIIEIFKPSSGDGQVSGLRLGSNGHVGTGALGGRSAARLLKHYKGRETASKSRKRLTENDAILNRGQLVVKEHKESGGATRGEQLSRQGMYRKLLDGDRG